MLYFLGAWLLLTVICGVMGLGWLNCWRAAGFDRLGDRVIAAQWLGLVTIAIALLTTSLFVPLSAGVGSAIAALGVGLALLLPATRTEIAHITSRLNRRLYGQFLLILLIAAQSMSGQITWIDTGLYHYGMIRWLSDYGAVPGVALIHSRFGWPSAWFAFAAPFNPEIANTRGTAVANGFLLVLAIAHWWLCLRHLLQKDAKLRDWFVIFMYPFLLGLFVCGRLYPEMLRLTWTFTNIIMSASNDFVVMMLIVMVSWSILAIAGRGNSSSGDRAHFGSYLVPFFLGTAACAMKLSALPLIPVAGLFYLTARPWRWRRLLWLGLILAAFLLPYMAFGVVTSGCPLSPSRAFCFDLPWTAALPEDVEKSLGFQEGTWQDWYGESEPASNTFYWFWAFRQWFESATLLGLSTILSLISLLIGGIITIRRKDLLKSDQYGQLWVVFVAIAGLSFVLWRSPLLRFGWGYSVVIPAMFCASWCHWHYGRFLPIFGRVLAISGKVRQKILQFLFWSITAFIIFQSVAWSWIVMPRPLLTVKVVPAQVNDVRYFYPVEQVFYSREMLCWGAPIPCTEYEEPQQNNVKLRRPEKGIAGGFVRADYEAED